MDIADSKPSGDPSVFNLLAQQQTKATTISNLNDAVKNTFVDTNNLQFWQGVIQVSQALKESRQYGGGLPIPETSKVHTETVGDGAAVLLQPSSPEVWQVVSIFAGNATASLTDGGSSAPIPADSNGNLYSPIYITPTMYLSFDNSSGGSVNIAVAYNKVGL